MKKIYGVTFSPTGGTEKVVSLLLEEMEGEKTVVSLLEKDKDYGKISFSKEDVCLLGVPSFGGRVPKTATERIEALQGNGARAVLVCVYGNRAYEDTLIELFDSSKKAGFRPVAAVSAVAEHSIMHQFAAGRPDEEDQAELRQFAKKISDMLSCEGEKEVQVPGNAEYKELGKSTMVPQPYDTCVSCGICAKECPVGAISSEDPKKTDAETCISCMRCTHVCPHHARGLDPVSMAERAKMIAKLFEVRRENELFLAETEHA